MSNNNEDLQSRSNLKNGGVRHFLINMLNSLDRTRWKLRKRELSPNKQLSSVDAPKYQVRSCRNNRRSSFRNNILNLAWSREWQGVLLCCQQCPQEAFVINESRGRSALHLALFSRTCPLPVLLALLDANPHAAILRDKLGYTPLHYACQFGHSIETIRTLCLAIVSITTHNKQDYDEKASFNSNPIIPYDSTASTSIAAEDDETNVTSSPLLLACRKNASIKILKVLMNTSTLCHGALQWIAPLTGAEPWYCDIHSQEIMYSDISKISPLHTLWNSLPGELMNHFTVLEETPDDSIHGDSMKPSDWNPIFEDEVSSHSPIKELQDEDDEEEEEEVDGGKLGKTFLLFRMTVRRMHSGFYKTTQKLPEKQSITSNQILYLVSSLAFPLPTLLQIIVKNYACVSKDKIPIVDEWNYSPMHHALASFQYHHRRKNDTSITKYSMNNIKEVLEHLLLYHTERSPEEKSSSETIAVFSSLLQLAIECQIPWDSGVLAIILEAEPDIISCTTRPSSGIYPFMLAALCDSSVETIYELLRRYPSVLSQP